MQIDDFFDAEYERGIASSAYHTAKYGYHDGVYVEHKERKQIKRREYSEAERIARYGEMAPLDTETIRASIRKLGIPISAVSVKAGFLPRYMDSVLRNETMLLERLEALCAVLNLDISEARL